MPNRRGSLYEMCAATASTCSRKWKKTLFFPSSYVSLQLSIQKIELQIWETRGNELVCNQELEKEDYYHYGSIINNMCAGKNLFHVLPMPKRCNLRFDFANSQKIGNVVIRGLFSRHFVTVLRHFNSNTLCLKGRESKKKEEALTPSLFMRISV